MTVDLILGDCIEVMKGMADKSVDAVITDPPYELGFMGKSWDNTGIAYQVGMWREVLRILKPGGHLLSFGGSRTYHRMACAIEDAGFEIRDQLQYIYGSGFPKSHDISKAIDKMAGAEREVVGKYQYPDGNERNLENCVVRNATSIDMKNNNLSRMDITAPSTPEAQYWQGWGTALKPAHEPIVLARKPLSEKTVANNVLAYGTGGINIDGCRVGTDDYIGRNSTIYDKQSEGWGTASINKPSNPQGRFPANILHDGSDEVVGMFPNSKGVVRQPTGNGILNPDTGWNNNSMIDSTVRGFNDSGSAARFFYSAKASRSERNAGCEDLELKNNHSTVKPIAIMRYLVRLITPPNGTVLDPFTGSGTTGIAAVLEGFDFIGIEREAEYHEIARRRIEHWQQQMRLDFDA